MVHLVLDLSGYVFTADLTRAIAQVLPLALIPHRNTSHMDSRMLFGASRHSWGEVSFNHRLVFHLLCSENTQVLLVLQSILQFHLGCTFLSKSSLLLHCTSAPQLPSSFLLHFYSIWTEMLLKKSFSCAASWPEVGPSLLVKLWWAISKSVSAQEPRKDRQVFIQYTVNNLIEYNAPV